MTRGTPKSQPQRKKGWILEGFADSFLAEHEAIELLNLNADSLPENLPLLLEKMCADLEANILALKKKKLRVTRTLKRLTLKAKKPGRPPSSKLREDAIVERAHWYAAQRKLARIAEYFSMKPYDLECELKRAGKFGNDKFFGPHADGEACNMRRLSSRRLARLLAPKYGIDLNAEADEETSYRPIDLFEMRVKQALRRS